MRGSWAVAQNWRGRRPWGRGKGGPCRGATVLGREKGGLWRSERDTKRADRAWVSAEACAPAPRTSQDGGAGTQGPGTPILACPPSKRQPFLGVSVSARCSGQAFRGSLKSGEATHDENAVGTPPGHPCHQPLLVPQAPPLRVRRTLKYEHCSATEASVPCMSGAARDPIPRSKEGSSVGQNPGDRGTGEGVVGRPPPSQLPEAVHTMRTGIRAALLCPWNESMSKEVGQHPEEA